MIIALSILVSAGVGWLLYRALFYDLADFMDGVVRLCKIFLVPRRRWPFAPRSKPPTAEDLEDGSWSSGIRFFFFLVLSALSTTVVVFPAFLGDFFCDLVLLAGFAAAARRAGAGLGRSKIRSIAAVTASIEAIPSTPCSNPLAR